MSLSCKGMDYGTRLETQLAQASEQPDAGGCVIRIETRLPLSQTTATALTAGCAGIGCLALLPVPPSPLFGAFVMMGVAGAACAYLLWGTGRAGVVARPAAQPVALTHPLTGLAMPPLAEATLAMQFAAAQRGRSLSVMLVRVEQLARYTSRHGRPMTDRLLRTAARTVARNTRNMNLSAHHRGDEANFLLILCDTPLEGACTFAKRLRRELMTLPGFPEGVAVSAGVASYDHDQSTPEDLLDRAERALAKGTAAGGKIIVTGRSANTTEI